MLTGSARILVVLWYNTRNDKDSTTKKTELNSNFTCTPFGWSLTRLWSEHKRLHTWLGLQVFRTWLQHQQFCTMLMLSNLLWVMESWEDVLSPVPSKEQTLFDIVVKPCSYPDLLSPLCSCSLSTAGCRTASIFVLFTFMAVRSHRITQDDMKRHVFYLWQRS